MNRERAAGVLGVEVTASKDAIERAYRRLAKVFHPDKGGDPNDFKRLCQAKEALLQERPGEAWQAPPEYEAANQHYADFHEHMRRQFGGRRAKAAREVSIEWDDDIGVIFVGKEVLWGTTQVKSAAGGWTYSFCFDRRGAKRTISSARIFARRLDAIQACGEAVQKVVARHYA